jgi:hypothetical protein
MMALIGSPVWGRKVHFILTLQHKQGLTLERIYGIIDFPKLVPLRRCEDTLIKNISGQS